jgi:hypothetical protein
MTRALDPVDSVNRRWRFLVELFDNADEALHVVKHDGRQ